MGKKTPKKQQSRQCIFCDNAASSKEHFWSGWMHPLLAVTGDGNHRRETITFHPSEGELIKSTGRQGDTRTIRIRAVCRECNQGWMNRLEGEARPLLTPIIEGTEITLAPDQIAVVAKWIALKCIVAEHNDGQSAVTPRCDRIAFKESGLIPSYFRIYMTSQHCDAEAVYLRHSQCIAFDPSGPSPPLDGVPNNIQTISFLLGRVFVHVNAARVDNFDLESRVFPTIRLKSGLQSTFWNLARIWPLIGRPMSWPRRPLLDATASDIIGDTLGIYQRASKVTWLDLPKS